MILLKIDTSNNLNTHVEIVINGNTFVRDEKRKTPGDQNVLELIERLLSENKLHLQDIESVEINSGPGSFTGLRVGVSIANALSFGCNITVNNKPLGDIVIPEY